MKKHDPLLWGVVGYILGRTTSETKNKEDVENSDAASGWIGLAALGILILSVWGITKHRFEFPAKQVVAIYYYGLVVPLEWIFSPWRYIYTEPLTHYPNLNIVFAYGAIVIIVVVVIFIVRFFFRTLGKLAWSLLALFLLGPWLFWVVCEIYKWLFE